MFEIMQEAIERLYGNASGLVIANDGKNFSRRGQHLRHDAGRAKQHVERVGDDDQVRPGCLHGLPQRAQARRRRAASDGAGRRLRDLPGRRPHRRRRRDLHGAGGSGHRRHPRLGRLQGDGAPSHQPAHERHQRQPDALSAPGLRDGRLRQGLDFRRRGARPGLPERRRPRRAQQRPSHCRSQAGSARPERRRLPGAERQRQRLRRRAAMCWRRSTSRCTA
jgi:hypothetical protein